MRTLCTSRGVQRLTDPRVLLNLLYMILSSILSQQASSMPSFVSLDLAQSEPSPLAMTKANSIAGALLADSTANKPSLACLDAPRRRHKPSTDPSQPGAQLVAQIMYPDLAPLPALIKYERTVVALRKTVLERLREEETARREAKGYTRRERVRKQGKWVPPDNFYDADYEEDPASTFSRRGGPAIPMPVTISDRETLAPFFDYLKSNRAPTLKPEIVLSSLTTDDTTSLLSDSEDGSVDHQSVFQAKHGQEPYYGVDMLEFEKGVVYTDNRMDLCKMVVGPHHIRALMQSLESNDHVKHFLLGNNIIGPTGAKAIAEFIHAHPQKIETWYLAGNMIDANGLKGIVESAAGSQVIHSVWLKRNPLGFESAATLLKLIVSCPKLRVLDIEQTLLSDDGVALIFEGLCKAIAQGSSISLETIYLNSTGVSDRACRAISRFLKHPQCKLSNLYLANDPVGDVGAQVLAAGLRQNRSLKRLTIRSCGMNSIGAIAISEALADHPTLMTLHIGQAVSTKDLGSRYNFIEDDALLTVAKFIATSPSLRSLSLGVAGITRKGLEWIGDRVSKSNLLHFDAESCFERAGNNPAIHKRLGENVQHEMGISYDEFNADRLRWLVSPEDVRFIDSLYRNRDAGLARRHLKVLKKNWDEDDETMKDVMLFEAA